MWNGTLYYDNEKAELVLNYQSNVTWQINNNWQDSAAFDVIPLELRPKHNVYSHTGDTRLVVRINSSSGKIQTVNSAQIVNPYIQCVLNWIF